MGDLTLTVHHQVFMSDDHNVNGTYLDEYHIKAMTIGAVRECREFYNDGRIYNSMAGPWTGQALIIGMVPISL